jgi:hypothetical protein
MQVIGDEETRGISGGQRKRVNVGIELVAGEEPRLRLWCHCPSARAFPNQGISDVLEQDHRLHRQCLPPQRT